MSELMENIVKSEVVQSLLEEIIDENLVTKEKFDEICDLVQKEINSDIDRLLLEPLEVVSIIEEAILIYSSRKQGTNFPVQSVDKSVELAFQKQLGVSEYYKITQI